MIQKVHRRQRESRKRKITGKGKGRRTTLAKAKSSVTANNHHGPTHVDRTDQKLTPTPLVFTSTASLFRKAAMVDEDSRLIALAAAAGGRNGVPHPRPWVKQLY